MFSRVIEVEHWLKMVKGCVCYIFAREQKGAHFLKRVLVKLGKIFYFISKAVFVLEKIKFWDSAFSNFMTSSNA